jgi:hypothetical protein
LQVFDTDEFIKDLKIRRKLFEDVKNEQIELQKEHIKHLEGLIYDKTKILEPLSAELESSKKEMRELKSKYLELEAFALKVHKNPIFKIYNHIKNIIK